MTPEAGPDEPGTAKVIWKYPLSLGGWGIQPMVKYQLAMPRGAVVLNLQVQAGLPTLWAEVTPLAPKENRIFEWAGTGWQKPRNGAYVGTVQLQDGTFVFHLYEVPA